MSQARHRSSTDIQIQLFLSRNSRHRINASQRDNLALQGTPGASQQPIRINLLFQIINTR